MADEEKQMQCERADYVEAWLRDEVVPVVITMQTNPERAIPADTVFAKIRAIHVERTQHKSE